MFVILHCGAMGLAQVSNETVPISWSFPPDQNGVSWQNLSFINPTGLLAEDNLVSKSEPMRFAKSRIVNLTPSTHGRWSNLSNGDRIWRLGIKCEGGFSVGLLFSKFSVPQGARLYIYADDQSQHLGPFTRSDNRAEGEILVTPPIYGERLIIEYYEPFAYRGQGDFEIKSVQHGYRDLRDLSGVNDENCLNILEPTVSNGSISSSVLMMIVDGGQKIATGTMVNNTSNNSSPYFLTSLNALKGNPEGWVFLFDVTEQECLNVNTCWSTAVCGAAPVSVDSLNGTALMTLRSAPPGNWSVYYSGWNTSISENSSGYKSIQHADGLFQSVAIYTGPLETVIWNGYHAKKVQGWSSGSTSRASIGSPLFDASNNLVGIYVGGDLSCDGSGADYFATFSASYPLYNSFLDPLRSGISSLAGNYPIPTESVTHTDGFDVHFFPNPATDWIYAQVLSEETKITEVQIFDGRGRLVSSVKPQTPTIDLNDLPEGLYIIQFFSGEKLSTQKLLIR